jgi:tRNA 2-selenouridine synthase SelU
MNNKLPPILDVKTAFEFEQNIKIVWNGSATFNVFNDGEEVNVFTDYTCKTIEQAKQSAEEWLEEQLQEERLDADI